MKETKALVLVEEQKNVLVSYTGTMFSDLDFKGLEQIINKIAESKDELTDGMRNAATEYAKQWEDLVVERLDAKKEKLETLLSFFETRKPQYYTITSYNQERNHYARNSGYTTCEPVIPVIIGILSTKDKWKKFAELLETLYDDIDQLEEACRESEPQRDDFLFDEDNMSYNDRCIALREFEYETAKWRREWYEKRFDIRKDFVDILDKLLKDTDIKELIKAIKFQITKAKQAYAVAKEKSSLVSLSINFGNTSILSALQELHEFQKTI